ncbi:hypothetical protein TNCT_532481 [Trichonephila clavata]|uniref:Uncharacterized protein n=1 Tax=Trichonephila clavata TaxID=2740835 RepID=A0A8X6GEY7_TRICU|nr:hypothetical protein TNCT_532481 [Trichonephila clavata]
MVRSCPSGTAGFCYTILLLSLIMISLLSRYYEIDGSKKTSHVECPVRYQSLIPKAEQADCEHGHEESYNLLTKEPPESGACLVGKVNECFSYSYRSSGH